MVRDMTATSRWLTDEERALWRSLLVAQRKVTRVIDDTLQRVADLSVPELAVLVALSEADGNRLRLRDLCVALGWDRSRTSHQVTRMQRRGLVAKGKCPNDARGVFVILTDEGRSRCTLAGPDYAETVRRLVFDHLDPADIPALRRFFDGIADVTNVPD